MEWLTDEQQAAWRPFIALLLRLPAALDAQLQRDAGITNFDYLVLSGLSESPSRTLRMSELAAIANSSLSRLSHVVSRLEARGWVRREPCPGDGRFINAVLTDEGWQKVLATAPGHVAAVRELLLAPLSRGGIQAARRHQRQGPRRPGHQDSHTEREQLTPAPQRK